MPTELESRVSRLEATEGYTLIHLIRQCPACGEMALQSETRNDPPCTRGDAHAPLPKPSPLDVVIERSYGQNDRRAA